MKSFKTFLSEDLRVKSQELDPTDPLTPIYYGLVSAEHRGQVKDPTTYDPKLAIRTKARHKDPKAMSTAYGPVQITGSTMRDALQRHSKLFNQSGAKYAQNFVNQADKFAKAKKGDKVYDYGGAGDLSHRSYHVPYQEAALAVIKGKMKDAGIDITKPLSDKDLSTTIQRWRGVPETKDSEYYKVARAGYAKYKEIGNQVSFNQSASANQQASGAGMNMEDDYLKVHGYAQSPVNWTEKYPENYSVKTEPIGSTPALGSSQQTTPVRRQSSTLQTAPSRPNNTGGKR
jgi:hypothetical protein